MFRTKTKNLAKTAIKIFLVSLILSLSLSSNVSYAAGDCPLGVKKAGDNIPGDSSDQGKTCTYAAELKECPNTFSGGFKDGETKCTKTGSGSKANEQAVKQAQFFVGLQKALNRLIWPILTLIGGLMDNSLLFGNGMEEKLRDIWIPIRNLVNILFVIVLVGIALYNVLGLGDENGQYSIKSALPKIIIGIIAINFSFLAIKVFLDTINVLTVSVFALPGQVSGGLDEIIKQDKDSEERKEYEEKLCANIQGESYQEFKSKDQDQKITDATNRINEMHAREQLGDKYSKDIHGGMDFIALKAAIAESDPKKGAEKAAEFEKKVERAMKGQFCNGGELSEEALIVLSKWDSRNAALAMALSMGQIIQYQDIHPESLKDVSKLAIGTLFSFFMYLIFTISFLALFIVLLARLVVMWVSIAVSPVLLLMMAAPTVKEKMGGFKILTDNFVNLAIAPLIIGLSMTVGWIMLNALQGIESFNKGNAMYLEPGGIPVVGLSNIQDLVVALGTVAIIWSGVFGAAEGTIADKATGFLKDQAQRAGKFIGTLPLKHTPLIPVNVPGAEGERFSAAEIGDALRTATQIDTGRLSRLLKPDKVRPDTLGNEEKVKTAKDLGGYLRGLGDDITSTQTIQKLKELSQRKINKPLWDKLDTAQRTAVQTFVDSEHKPADVKALLGTKGIKGTHKLDLGEGDRKPKPTGGAAAAAGTVKPPTITRATKATAIGAAGKTMADHIDSGNAADKPAALARAENEYNTGLEMLGQRLGAIDSQGGKAKPEDVARIKEIISGNLTIKPEGGTPAAPTADQVKAAIGDAAYKTLEKAMGGSKEKLEAALQEGANPTPEPPAAPPAPAP